MQMEKELSELVLALLQLVIQHICVVASFPQRLAVRHLLHAWAIEEFLFKHIGRFTCQKKLNAISLRNPPRVQLFFSGSASLGPGINCGVVPISFRATCKLWNDDGILPETDRERGGETLGERSPQVRQAVYWWRQHNCEILTLRRL